MVLAAALIVAFAASAFSQSGEEALASAKSAFKAKRFADAVKNFKIVTEEYPDWSFGHFYLGLSYKQTRDYTNAVRSLKRALDLANNENELFGASIELADTYYCKQDYSNAVKQDPQDLAAHLTLVKSLLNDSKWVEALEAADFALQTHGCNWELHYLKGRALQKLGRLNLAAASLRQSLKIQHNDKVARLLGDVYRDNGDYLPATNAYNSAQRSYAKDPTYFVSFAFAWYKYVPANVEIFDDKWAKYKRALESAVFLLNYAKRLHGADQELIDAIMKCIQNKRDRMEKAIERVTEYDIFIDPGTGKVEKRKIGEKKN